MYKDLCSYKETAMVAILIVASPLTGTLKSFNKNSSHLLYCQLICGPYLHAPLKLDQSHFTTLHFNIYAHQSAAMDFAKGIFNTLANHHSIHLCNMSNTDEAT